MSTAAPIQDAIPVLSSEERLAAAEKIVRKHIYITAGVGVVPIPVINLVGVGAGHANMIRELSNLYGVKFSDRIARNLVVSLLGTLTSTVFTGGAAALSFKFIPGFAAAIVSLLAVPATAGALTWAIGRVFIKHFEDGGTLLDLNVSKAKDFFQSQYKVGQKTSVATAAA